MPGKGKPFGKDHKGGRPKGVQNKLTRTVKETVLAVFNKIQEDPKVNLEKFAKDFPRDFYQIAAKLIPTEMTGGLDQITVRFIRDDGNTDTAKEPTPGTEGNP